MATIAVSVFGLFGCATTEGADVTGVRLDALVVDGNRLARGDEPGLATVIRSNVSLEARAGMTLLVGDRIETGPRADAVIRYPSGSEVLMRPASGGRIGGLADVVGEVFVKVKGIFSVDTALVKAAAHGTAYVVRAPPEGVTSVVVIEGVVDVSSTTGAWPLVRLEAGSMASAHPFAPQPRPADVEDLRRIRDWVERIERLAPLATNTTATGSVVGIGIATAVAAILAASDRCPAAKLSAFPWPTAPAPSDSALIANYLLWPDGLEGKTLMDVARRLESSIAAAGYLEPRYLGAGCQGFAIVLDLEQIDALGARKPGAAGFAAPTSKTEFTLPAYLKGLFRAPPGYYRQIVFVVSEQNAVGTTPAPTPADLRAIAKDGSAALPPEFANLPFTWKHRVVALVYEFEKGAADGDAQQIPPTGRLSAPQHLKRAHLF